MDRYYPPTRRAPFLSSHELKQRLASRQRLASHLLGQVTEAFLGADSTQFDIASGAFNETQVKVARLERELSIVEGAESFVDRLAEAQPELGKITIASVAYGQGLQYLRVGQVDLTDRH